MGDSSIDDAMDNDLVMKATVGIINNCLIKLLIIKNYH